MSLILTVQFLVLFCLILAFILIPSKMFVLILAVITAYLIWRASRNSR